MVFTAHKPVASLDNLENAIFMNKVHSTSFFKGIIMHVAIILYLWFKVDTVIIVMMIIEA